MQETAKTAEEQTKSECRRPSGKGAERAAKRGVAGALLAPRACNCGCSPRSGAPCSPLGCSPPWPILTGAWRTS